MGDLNPNRAGNVLYLNDAGGDIDLIEDGVSNVVVAQLGNLVTMQLKDTVGGSRSASNEEALFETVLDTTDPLVARIDPGDGSITVPLTGVVDSIEQAATVIITKVADKIQFNVKPPVAGWSSGEGSPDLLIENSQMIYAAAPQLDRDYRLLV
jgi:hypothetical protein